MCSSDLGISRFRSLQGGRVLVANGHDFRSLKAAQIADNVGAPVPVTNYSKSNHNVSSAELLLLVGCFTSALLASAAAPCPLLSLICVAANVKVVLDQYAPSPARTAPGVRTRIFMSSHSDHVMAYCKSSRTMSSNVVLLRPVTCHSPVMPGLTSRRRRRCHTS